MSVIQLSEQQVETLWSPVDHEPTWSQPVRVRLREIAEQSNTQFGQWLLGKTAMQEVRVEHVRELESHLGMDHTMRNMLRSVTHRLRKRIPRFPLAGIAIAVKRAANPINPDTYTASRIERSHRLLLALKDGLKLDLDSVDAETRIGLLLLNAAYSGGLLDIAQLNALLKVSLESIEWLAGIPEIRLSLSIQGVGDAEYRQWFPDPASLALLIRCADDVKTLNAQALGKDGKLKCIQALLSASGMPVHDLPCSLTELLDLLRMQMQLRLPQLLVNFACRKSFVSQSLRPSSWGYLFGDAFQEDPAQVYGDDIRSDTAKDSDAPVWVLELCQRVRAGESIEPSLQSETQTELAALFRGWIAFMLSGASAYGHQVGRKTIARYARLLGPALASQLDGVSIFELESDSLEIVYEMALEAQSTDGKRRTLAKAVYEFHTFLQRRYSYPPISPYSLLGIGKGLTRVDAHVLSEEQYQAVLQALGNCGLELRTPRLVTAARLFMILGFRLGLRRSEALKLRLSDIHFPELSLDASARILKRHPNMRRLSRDELAWLDLPVDLLVRPHAQRNVKSQNAVRRLPLHVLLEPDELELLREWYRQREEEAESPASEYLFCIPQLRTQWISESYLLPALHACMREVTGSDSVHYHHLRHSCATWLLLKLMVTLNELSPGLILRDLPLTTSWLENGQKLSHEMFARNGGPTRRIVHMVSAILGHGSPKTTLLHYIHSLPLIMAMAWQWNPKCWLFSASNVTSIANVSQPTKPTPPAGVPAECQRMIEIIGRIKLLKARKQARKKVRARPIERQPSNWAIERIAMIESMLAYVSYGEQSNRPVNLEWLEFSAESRALMLERARHIRDLPDACGRKRGGRKHRMLTSEDDSSRSYVTLRPMPPKHGGREAVAPYAQKLYELLDGPKHERAIRVIDYFVENSWATDTCLRFRRGDDEKAARDYLWLLEAIGIPARSIELVIYDNQTPTQTKSYWRTVIRKARCPIAKHEPFGSDHNGYPLGIRASLKVASEDRNNHHSNAALRYLFLMASIDWHFRG
ncbi:tyrosine-type recombinase/integrase [Pseudomonas sp. N040]|uniref:tyrosine-type recombinase/integrase n=1 Tax=Pseudomonas sp. N040 TaxID=2785325 RepID=UPI0018A267F2|nr:tyrosine-type recombinase/integrase [Pseudomonas sp. N040]MBF7728612.1 tyrosine-type recombinase/integrase [Pseudomonas sp. N040]MBW7012252.1 tyrosine-type recombinase/integrase [Pseudomonas sp. N040]